MGKELIIDTLSVGNALSANSVMTEDIHVNGISVKDCLSALEILSCNVSVEIDGQSYIFVGFEL